MNSYNGIANGWEYNDEWNKIKEQTASNEWATNAKILKCIQTIMNNKKNEHHLVVCGV